MVKKYSLVFIVSIVVIIIDILTKWVIHNNNFSVIILSFLKIIPVKNTGAAFSILQNATIPLIFISLAVIGLILFYLDKIEEKYTLAVSLILGGAIGNLIDRIFFGFVRDFISVSSFPVFNIADAAVTMGAIIWIWQSFRKE